MILQPNQWQRWKKIEKGQSIFLGRQAVSHVIFSERHIVVYFKLMERGQAVGQTPCFGGCLPPICPSSGSTSEPNSPFGDVTQRYHTCRIKKVL